MGDEPQQLGGNAQAELKRRVERRISIVDQIAELQEEMKLFKGEDKSDGFTEKVIAQMVKEKRADADKILAQLTLEAEIDVARHAVGLPTDLETAHRLSQQEAETLPEPKRERKSKDDDNVVSLGSKTKPDKTKH
jgi:uncharacterized protein (UPF0335 family)